MTLISKLALAVSELERSVFQHSSSILCVLENRAHSEGCTRLLDSARRWNLTCLLLLLDSSRGSAGGCATRVVSLYLAAGLAPGSAWLSTTGR